ncbi:dynamin family protein [Pseudonocardia abyssalis]|uniref:Dynamin family protein n=1 Tax=Pseudonocardia abyssalis TaxID=2792008 RepID=A0ABS6V0I2_9PSEU|nr:dynamin family protein [Pseudonocardia abyssalis]MBW0116697.1 dynamin family protein [Pseudonocardia abyssalis]MBW0137912.1 dynamin family protein [Pseudonocardia abyssalis]
MTRSLTDAARDLLLDAARVYRDDPGAAGWLTHQVDRLEEPLRLAVAGKVKAGKSTLLNALVGERLAPVDAGECTKVVTWFRDAPTSAVTMVGTDGSLHELPVDRRDGALLIDLQGRSADDVEMLVVDWPSQSLRVATLIDTPGLASLSHEVGRRTLRFLHPDDERPTDADAVVYLMRHLHAGDAEFLEAFRGRGVAQTASVNSLAVISRADEIGGGRVDAMVSARAIARRYRSDPALRGLAQNIVAVAGLVGETARTLRQTEFTVLASLARQPKEAVEASLLTVDRFVAADSPIARAVPELTAAQRAGLLRRFGVFGLRLSTMLIRQGVATPAALAADLVQRSGLGELQAALESQFVERRTVLKARSALLAVHQVVQDDPVPGSRELSAELERILTGAHEFTELRLLGELRFGSVVLPRAIAAEGAALLGGTGAGPAARLGLPADAGPDDLRAAALDALARWQEHAENPMLDRSVTAACRTVVRTCEGLVTT